MFPGCGRPKRKGPEPLIEPRPSIYALISSEFPRISLLKLSEKGSERGFDRRFGQYTNAKTARKVSFRCPVRLRCRGVRGFSDSFSETVRKASNTLIA